MSVDCEGLNYGGLAIAIGIGVSVGVALECMVVGIAMSAGLGVVFSVAMGKVR